MVIVTFTSMLGHSASRAGVRMAVGTLNAVLLNSSRPKVAFFGTTNDGTARCNPAVEWLIGIHLLEHAYVTSDLYCP